MHHEPPIHRRLVENEVMARQLNQNVEEGFEKIRTLTKEEGHAPFITATDAALHFFCECANTTCSKRIVMLLSVYNALHTRNDQFIVVPGHEVAEIERTIETHDDYNVVQKFDEPPTTVDPNRLAHPDKK